MSNRIVTALAAAAALAGATAASAQTYSFETPSFTGTGTGFAYNPSQYTGATFNDQSGVSAQGAFFNSPPPEGTQAAFVQSISGSIGSLTLAFSGLTIGGSYAASFFLAQRPQYAANTLNVSFTDALGLSTALGSYTPGGVAFTAFKTPTFVATSSSGNLTFRGSSSSYDNDTALDLVSIAGATTGGAVPEPAAWLTMIAGMGLIGAAARRRAGAGRAHATA